MNNAKRMLTGLLASALLVTSVWGQEGERRPDRPGRPNQGSDGPGAGQGGPGNPMMMERMLRSSPLFRALDADQDGLLSADEINNAANVLKDLDKNNDGKLTPDEWMPPPPAAGRGPQRGPGGAGRSGGPGGRGGEGGPGGPGGRGGRGAEGGTGGPAGTGAGMVGAGIVDRLMQFANDRGEIEREKVPERVQPMFDRADANRDGILDKKELDTMAQRIREGMGGNRGQGNRGQGNRGEGNRGEGNRGEGNRGEGNRGEGNRGEGNRGGRGEGAGGRGRGGNQPPIRPGQDGGN